jgi:hypothetical protein
VLDPGGITGRGKTEPRTQEIREELALGS